MNYIVFDLEWNQSNAGASSVEGFPFEIIEIGAVKLTGNGVLDGEFNELIRPLVYKEMLSPVSILGVVIVLGAIVYYNYQKAVQVQRRAFRKG